MRTQNKKDVVLLSHNYYCSHYRTVTKFHRNIIKCHRIVTDCHRNATEMSPSGTKYHRMSQKCHKCHRVSPKVTEMSPNVTRSITYMSLPAPFRYVMFQHHGFFRLLLIPVLLMCCEISFLFSGIDPTENGPKLNLSFHIFSYIM